MIRSSCDQCGASLWRGVERDIGQALVDVAPLTIEEEAALLVASVRDDGWRRRRLSYDILTTDGKDAPQLECRRGWKPERPRGYVVITHRCGQPPAARVPVFPPEVTADDGPPFFPRGGIFSPVEDAGAFFPPHAELFSPGPETGALAVLTIPYGACPLCGLLNPANDKGVRKQGLCTSCRGFAHGRIYDETNTPVVGWCEVSSHRRRAATRNTLGQWDCGRHANTSEPARNTLGAGAATLPGA